MGKELKNKYYKAFLSYLYDDEEISVVLYMERR